MIILILARENRFANINQKRSMIMKRYVSWLLALIMVLSCISVNALALGYHPIQNEEPTFETLEEARANGPEAVKQLFGNETKNFISHPALDSFNPGTVFVYRSAHLFGTRAAARLNTNIIVYSGEHFDDKDAAYAYLEELGLIAIIDEAIGSIVLVTPNVPLGAAPAGGLFSFGPVGGFGAADMQNYYALQTAMLSQGGTATTADGMFYTSDAEYFGGYGYIYVIGIDDGATFLNNYIVDTFDFASRIAGLLLINGTMEPIRKIATFIPTYLVNPQAKTLDKYKDVNGVDFYVTNAKVETWYNSAFPLRRVSVAKEEKSYAEYIKDAYYDMFIKAMRIPVVKIGMYTAGTPYNGYSFDQAPYSLCVRNAVINGRTADGINLFEHQEDRFAYMAEDLGEYIETWYEYLPDEVLDGTAPDHTIPLILCNHGMQDDPRLFVDENGFLELAGKERIALVAPEHQYVGTAAPTTEGNPKGEYLAALVRYMLDTYPALDPSHVYVSGYSMGGAATFIVGAAHPELFAAMVPMAMYMGSMEESEKAVFETLDIPFLLSTSSYDVAWFYDSTNDRITDNTIGSLDLYMRANELGSFSPADADFEAYPYIGFACDEMSVKVLNGEYINRTWMFNKDDVPMVGITITEGLVHALYPEYAKLMWNFAKHYSRNQETLEIEYNPYVD